MPGFMIGSVTPLTLRHQNRFALRTHEDLVLGPLKILHVDEPLVAARSKQRRLIHQIGEIGSGHPGSSAGEGLSMYIGCDRHFAHMHVQYLLTAPYIGEGD